MTIFARRIPGNYPMRFALISSLMETIRLRIVVSPASRHAILDFVARLLMNIVIDERLSLSVKVARVKIEMWEITKK